MIEDNTGKTVKALLYRGTPDNPAFWKRAYLDLSYAAGESAHGNNELVVHNEKCISLVII